MSSILEALRELESRRPPAAERVVTPVALPEAPRERPVGPLVAVTTGLGLGFLVFATAVWVSGLYRPVALGDPAPAAAPPPPAAAAPERPSWLDTADAPRARVEPNATAPERPARAAARPEEPPPAPAAVAAQSPAPAKSAPAGRIDVVSIDYSPSIERRSATMLLDGRRVTLRQRESAAGIEVQLIMPNGVYVQRGAETFLVSPR